MSIYRMQVMEKILFLLFFIFIDLTNTHETIDCSELSETPNTTNKAYLDVTLLNESATANHTNCIKLRQAKKFCQKNQHRKWIRCNVSITEISEKLSNSTSSPYVNSNTLHRPVNIKPTTESSRYFSDDLDVESDIFGSDFQPVKELLEEAQFLDWLDDSTDDSESEITTIIPEVSDSTTTTTTSMSTTSSSTKPESTTSSTAPTASTATTERTSRLPRTTPALSNGIVRISGSILNILGFFVVAFINLW